MDIKPLVLSELSRAFDTADIFKRNGLQPDDWQSELLSLRHKRVLCANSRQSGKSLASCAAAATIAALNDNCTVIFVSPSQRQSQENIKRCSDLVIGAGYEGEIASTKQLEIHFKNQSRIITVPSNASGVRGYSNVRGLLLEECAFFGDDSIFEAVFPFVATQPQAIVYALSTPNGRNNWFARQWFEVPHWKRIEVPATLISRIPSEFLAQQRLELGERKFSQEYMCQFISGDSAFLPADIIERAFVPGLGAI